MGWTTPWEPNAFCTTYIITLLLHILLCRVWTFRLQFSESIFTSNFSSLFFLSFKARRVMNEEGGLREGMAEGGAGSRNVFLLAGNWCNEPKRLPIIPLAIGKRKGKTLSLLLFLFIPLTSHTLTSIDSGWNSEGRRTRPPPLG